ncbi:aminotransferase class I/II-fold pyridoxal phosphate-dependent enzyme [Thermoplasma sp.]|uniref:aminotransferase class I/II-fold pyridoxal phosphate-dependent enzyme n=1 Tax=Thermoplasma sp. TaxID=1973142 RepID=UPI002630D31A|nr:aminotransferase class I/II-fold pyridoxal phosphate-dependent enzyme [Thermoplasma sp.]
MSKELQFPIRDNFDKNAYSVNFPIYVTTAYRSPEGDHFRYSREMNPTVEELARQMGILENAENAVCFSSGMGAISTVFLSLIRPGDRLVLPIDVFGRTYSFARDFMSRYGIDVKTTDPGTEKVIDAIDRKTRMVFVESVSNPLLRVYDIPKLAEAARQNGAILVVDDTIITPIGQRALELGADLAVNSLSKFIGGHNAAIGGSASGSGRIIEEIDKFRRSLGTSMDPFSAFLFLQGIKTLKIRVETSSQHAAKIAEELMAMDHIMRVYYPGISDDDHHDLAKKLLKNYGAVVSFVLDQNIEVQKFMSSLEAITPANTMGGVSTLISNPQTMSHRSLSDADRKRIGITPSLMRLSVGIEDPSFVIEDIRDALRKSTIQ